MKLYARIDFYLYSNIIVRARELLSNIVKWERT